jgi:hypothetical protein
MLTEQLGALSFMSCFIKDFVSFKMAVGEGMGLKSGQLGLHVGGSFDNHLDDAHV